MNSRVAIGWRELVAVMVGGMLGTGIRLAIDLWLPHTGREFPLATLLVNVVGSFLLGVLVATVWARPATPNWLKAGLGVGTLGAFTTFSAVMVSLAREAASGLWMLAFDYLIASVVLGFAAAALGLKFGKPVEPDWVDE